MYPFGQSFVNGTDLFLDGLDDLAAVAATQHHHDTGDHLALPVLGYPALPDFGGRNDGGDVADEDRTVIDILDDDVLDVGHVADLSKPPHNILFAVVLEVVTPRHAVVASDGVHDIRDADVEQVELFGQHRHLKLLHKPPERVDFGDALHHFQLRRNEPVLDFAQFGEGMAIPLDRILVDFAECRGDGPEHGTRHIARKVVGNGLEPLAHQLPREIDVGAFIELDGDRRQSKLGDRPYLRHLGKSVHGGFDRITHQLFDVKRRVPSRLGNHQHLHRSHVGQ